MAIKDDRDTSELAASITIRDPIELETEIFLRKILQRREKNFSMLDRFTCHQLVSSERESGREY